MATLVLGGTSSSSLGRVASSIEPLVIEGAGDGAWIVRPAHLLPHSLVRSGDRAEDRPRESHTKTRFEQFGRLGDSVCLDARHTTAVNKYLYEFHQMGKTGRGPNCILGAVGSSSTLTVLGLRRFWLPHTYGQCILVHWGVKGNAKKSLFWRAALTSGS
ncbi:hypothetical protein F5Y18DRAFT_434365 [Xylariaceae sp. FL1019]|nr:hypothetical protein F5Y18DRAFT_434365 [Xylariaceae sp. FL1019]